MPKSSVKNVMGKNTVGTMVRTLMVSFSRVGALVQ